MYTISKDLEFAAAHRLPSLGAGHPCSRMHGHNYTVRVTLGSETLDEHGMVLDYGKLDVVKKYLDDKLHHSCLNDLAQQPTAELLAVYLYAAIGSFIPARVKLISVGVSETGRTWATYCPS